VARNLVKSTNQNVDSPPKLLIAIDGPAGSGKSSTAQLLAERLCLKYLDTGMMYRVVAYQFLESAEFSTEDRNAADQAINGQVLTEVVIPMAHKLKSNFSPPLDPINRKVILNQRDITFEIREPQVSQMASEIAKISALREILVSWQREIIAKNPRIVCEGRDTTTRVAPEADLKILLVANSAIRQRRRSLENSVENLGLSESLADRDQADNRVNALFEAALGVVKLDNSDLTLEQTVEKIIGMLNSINGKT
jgi:cytidylate kinase